MTATVTRRASTRHYPAQRPIVRVARDRATAALRKWRLPVSVDDAALVVSELLTNAIETSAPTSQVTLHLRWTGISLLIGVWDSSRSMPTIGTVGNLTLDDIAPDPEALSHDEDRVGGWGLPLVQAVAADFQVERTASPAGKWVIAVMPALSIAMKDERDGAA